MAAMVVLMIVGNYKVQFWVVTTVALYFLLSERQQLSYKINRELFRIHIVLHFVHPLLELDLEYGNLNKQKHKTVNLFLVIKTLAMKLLATYPLLTLLRLSAAQ